jgi:RNA polymerase sigma-70 factor, ECF subfamily
MARSLSADALRQHQAYGHKNGFRRGQALDESPSSRRLVAQVVARAKEGDRDAIRFLYARYSDNVYGYVCSILRDDHEAEDVTQHVFAKLITAIGKYEQRAMPFSAWILRVAHNAAIDHLRTRRTTPCEEVRAPEATSDGRGLECRRSLREALGELPEEQRQVVVMRHIGGLSPREIADRLGRSEGSVHALHHRGRRALRRHLVDMGAAPRVAAAAG